MAKKLEDNVNTGGIDMSKIANLEAVKSTDKNFAKVVDNTGMFQTEMEKIQLPSGGKPYLNTCEDEDVKNGFIVIREMKGHDEKVLANPRFIKDGSVYRRILDNCIKSNIKAEDLITTDFNYLLFALRSLSYGDDYSFSSKCQNASCEKTINPKIKISSLNWEELPEDFEEPVEIELPRTKYTVKCILPRQYHVEMLRQEQMKVDSKKNDNDYFLIKKFTFTTIEIVDPNGNALDSGKDRKTWEKFFSDLPVRDLAELREKTKFNTDIEELDYICEHCGETQKVSIPIGSEFFRL